MQRTQLKVRCRYKKRSWHHKNQSVSINRRKAIKVKTWEVSSPYCIMQCCLSCKISILFSYSYRVHCQNCNTYPCTSIIHGSFTRYSRFFCQVCFNFHETVFDYLQQNPDTTRNTKDTEKRISCC